MNTQMHTLPLRQKTLLKTYLEVDMNEYIQQQMDSQLFEGVDEVEKAKFVGNFFHFIKCRFNDCDYVQTKAEVHSPPAADSKTKEDKKNLGDWSSGKGNHVPAYSANDQAYVQTKTEKKEKLVTNTVKEDLAQMKKDEVAELSKPLTVNENKADPEPTNVLIKAEEIKK